MTSTGTAIALISLVLAAVWCAARAIRSKTGLEQRLGQTTWDFAKSWASNLASAGSILGLVLGASKGLPQSNLALTATVLSILFGALVILGPISYYGLQVVQNGTLEGTVGGFVVASTLLLWAAFGELATAAAFVQDLADKLPAPSSGFSWP